MKRVNGLSAAVIAAAVLVGTSAFADSRPQNETWREQNRGGNRGGYSDRGGYRDNDRVTLEGRVSSFERERDGYRVHLDHHNYSFFVPERHIRNRRDFRVGISIRLGGVFRGGSIFVDAVDYLGGGGLDPYYGGRAVNDGYIRGVVERIDYRRDVVVVRDERSGRFVTVDMRRTDRRGRVDADDLRRGDFISLSGEWVRDVFVAYRVDSVRSGGNYGYGRRY
jgi:hypothetical protein